MILNNFVCLKCQFELDCSLYFANVIEKCFCTIWNPVDSCFSLFNVVFNLEMEWTNGIMDLNGLYF